MYYVAPLSNSEVTGGILFKIQDFLINQSDSSIKKIMKGARDLTDKEILIYYDNGQANPVFHEKWGDDIIDVAYINEIAYQLLLSEGLVSPLPTTDKLPDNLAINLRIPYYS